MRTRVLRPPALTTAAIAAVIALALTACGSETSGGGGAAGLPDQVKILSVTDLTGSAALYGKAQLQGAQLAVEDINGQRFLGGTSLALDSKDAGGSPQDAVSFASSAMADSSVRGLLGPIASAEAVAVAPVVQAGQFPTLFNQANSDGVILGEYTFRVTAPISSYYDLVLKYLQSKSVQRLAIVYDSGVPTLKQLAEQLIPDGEAKYGYSVTSTTGVPATTTDYSAPLSRTLAAQPDAVVVLLYGTALPTIATQLRNAGFDGTVASHPGAAGGALKPAGAAAANWFYPVDYSALAATTDVQKKFVESYRAKFGADPLYTSAEAYDAMWMFARAIKLADSADRTAIQKGLDQVAGEGFDGVEGKLTFTERDLRLPGVLLRWDGQADVLAAQP